MKIEFEDSTSTETLVGAPDGTASGRHINSNLESCIWYLANHEISQWHANCNLIDMIYHLLASVLGECC